MSIRVTRTGAAAGTCPHVRAARPACSPTLPARARRRRRRILRRRQRRVPRTPIQPTLELANPSLEPLVRIDQPPIRLDQLVKPKQQTDRHPTITIQDRLRLGPLHPAQLRRNTTGPCARAERLQKTRRFQRVLEVGGTGLEPVTPSLSIRSPTSPLVAISRVCRHFHLRLLPLRSHSWPPAATYRFRILSARRPHYFHAGGQLVDPFSNFVAYGETSVTTSSARPRPRRCNRYGRRRSPSRGPW